MSLRLDWCGFKAARYACIRWHYSGSMPAGKLVKIGVWEGDRFIGAVVFGRGATSSIGKPYGLPQTEICELVRVALDRHRAPVSKIVAIALRMLRKRCSGIRLVISYAAAEEGHVGAIYQAGNWIYEGPKQSYCLVVNGQRVHARTINIRYGRADIEWIQENVDPAARKVIGLVRHKYLMPMDDGMKAAIGPLAQPYPKRVK